MSYKNHVAAITTWQTRELWHRNEILRHSGVVSWSFVPEQRSKKLCSSRWGFLSVLLSILQEGKHDHELINLSVCPCVPHIYHWNCVTLIQISQITRPPVATSCMDAIPPEPSLVSHGCKNKTDVRIRKLAAMLTTQYWAQKWGVCWQIFQIYAISLHRFFSFGRT